MTTTLASPSTPLTTPPAADDLRLHPTSHIAALLGNYMANHRHQDTEKMLRDTLARMDELGIPDVALSPKQHVSREEVLALVLGRIPRHQVYDSEGAQATRGFRAILPGLYGNFMAVRGWLSGEIIVVDGRRYQLTGSACRDCKTAPEAYRSGGGIGCSDRINCGFWTCMGGWGYDHS